ncbi:hypothetical protein ATANTOWER_018803 [Ataeniobius toweri]|uniref:Uncharacterized protein n=1 Tax=Ataeniobius toweri TaxID=208326 RepID=A0ABU7CBF9_9TELE|nr:hypothetical protein [Ataeniobius toweri]
MPAKQKRQSQTVVPPEPTPYILPYIGRGRVKTTNPKHTPPTRNHSAHKQTPSQYKAEKPDANAKLAAPTLGGQSRRAQDCHTAEDRTQQRVPKAKAVHKAHIVQMRPHQPSKNKAPRESAPP